MFGVIHRATGQLMRLGVLRPIGILGADRCPVFYTTLDQAREDLRRTGQPLERFRIVPFQGLEGVRLT